MKKKKEGRDKRGPKRIPCAEQHAAPIEADWMPPAFKGGRRWVGGEKRANTNKTLVWVTC